TATRVDALYRYGVMCSGRLTWVSTYPPKPAAYGSSERVPLNTRTLWETGRLHCNSRLLTRNASSPHVKERVLLWGQNWSGCNRGFHKVEMLVSIFFGWESGITERKTGGLIQRRPRKLDGS